jgi:1-acyl-sn-glycerol-3-phosphate acyltransferase
MKIRAFRRAVALGFTLALCMVRYWLLRLRGPLSMDERGLYGHSCGQPLMSALGIRLRYSGELPAGGLVVSNHLSYIDVLIYGAIIPCFFVAKAEISGWPFFGMFARSGGTLFVDRSSRASAEQVSREIAERLEGTVPVLMFPEGTSTDGSRLLRFRSRLFTPAIEGGAPVTAAAIRYVIEDGTPERELCWFGDDAFLPHLWKALGTAGFTAEVTFGEPRVYTSRRAAADATQAEVEAMRSQEVQEVLERVS